MGESRNGEGIDKGMWVGAPLVQVRRIVATRRAVVRARNCRNRQDGLGKLGECIANDYQIMVLKLLLYEGRAWLRDICYRRGLGEAQKRGRHWFVRRSRNLDTTVEEVIRVLRRARTRNS